VFTGISQRRACKALAGAASASCLVTQQCRSRKIRQYLGFPRWLVPSTVAGEAGMMVAPRPPMSIDQARFSTLVL